MKIDLDFAISYRSLDRNNGGGGSVSYIITALAIIVGVVIVSVLGFFVFVNINDAISISEMRAQLSEFELQKVQISTNQKALDVAVKKQTTMDDVNSMISLHRMVSKTEIDAIYRALDKGVRVERVKYENSAIELYCKTESVYAPSNSAENLEKIGVSALVEYNGFTYEDLSKEKIGAGGEVIIEQADPLAPKTYIFKLSCYLNAKETAVK